MVEEHRDEGLESSLQQSLDDGNSVWLVGDIHGYRAEFEMLLDKLHLSDGDMVLCMGDLIDRGEDSHGVLSIVRESSHIFSIKGNHELIMSESLRGDTNKEAFWINKVGGRATLESMPGEGPQEKWDRAIQWLEFTDSLPTEVIIEKFRICHSGYRIDIPFQDQTDEDRLKSREAFLANRPLDEQRQVVAGHTPVQMLFRYGLEVPKEGVWSSDVFLKDGRPSVVLIDTGIVLRDPIHRPRISAYNLQTGSLEEIERINQILT
tara:strand:+ start:820 stop:1608 length:789 start_codon:yes stop_codon:yes gene_type:complete